MKQPTLTPEALRMSPTEVNRARELIGRPRAYIRRRAEDVRFEQPNYVRACVTQTVLIPAILDDFDNSVLASIPPQTSLDQLLLSHGSELRHSATMRNPRLITLGFFPKRPFPSVRAYDASGSQLPILTTREASRLFTVILSARYEAAYGIDSVTLDPVPGWPEVEELLNEDLESLILKPPSMLNSDENTSLDFSTPLPDNDQEGAPCSPSSLEGYSDFHLRRLLTRLRSIRQDGNNVARRMLEADAPEVEGDIPSEGRLPLTLARLSRAAHRFAVVSAAVGERLIIQHDYREPITYMKGERPERGYVPLALFGVVPRHVALHAPNHNHAHSFWMTVEAPAGSSIEYLLWSQRAEADQRNWALVDDITQRGPVVSVSSVSHDDQRGLEQAEMELDSKGVTIAAFQLEQGGIARDAFLVGLLLLLLLVVGTLQPSSIIDSSGGAASLVLVLPASALALLAQRFPEPVTGDFAHLVRYGLLTVASVGFAAATVGGLKLVKSPWLISLLSAGGLFVTGIALSLVFRLAYMKRSREMEREHRHSPATVIADDVKQALWFVAGFACLWLLGVGLLFGFGLVLG